MYGSVRGFAVVATAFLSACATTPSSRTPSAAQCEATPAQAKLGAKATQDLGAELLKLTGARQLRWIAPGMAVTMDFRPDRLSVSYDENLAIVRIVCG